VKTPNLTVRQKGDLAIVDINGKFNQTDGRQAFRETIGRLTEDDAGRILLNMAGITDLNQTGLRELLTECAAIAGAGKLKFLNVNKRVKARLQKAGLRHVFATREECARAAHSASAAAGSLHAPGSEYFFG
jgi:anti-sigma B factor antagonist